jgi:predicted RND superfamily exporter protein
MKRFEQAFGKWVLRYRWPIIILSLIFVALATTGSKNIYFTTNYRVFFSEDNPELLEFEALENTYVQNDNVFFIIEPSSGKVFTRETLSAVEYLTERAWQTPFSNRVDSITNFQYTEAEGDDLIVRDLVEGASTYSEEQLLELKEITLNEPLLHNRLISDRTHVTGINVNVQLPRINEDIETPEVVSFSRALAREVEAAYPDIKVRLTGMVMMNNAFSESAKDDIANLVPISFAVMLLLLAVLVGGITGTFCTLMVIACSIMVAMGIGGYIGFPISPPSATFPTIILTIAIANCVHILVTFLHDMRAGMSKHEALIESLRINLQPVFLASLTTAIGFLMMNFSDVPPFRHLGNFVAIGVATSFIMSVTFLPALISLLPVRVKEKKDDHDRLMEKFGDFVVRRRSFLFWGMCALILVLLTGLPRNDLNDVFVHYFDETIDFRVDSDFSTDNLTGIYNIEYSLNSGEPGGISNPGYLHDVDAFANWFRQQPEILHVNTYSDITKRLNKNMHGDDPAMYKIPDERNLAAQYLLLYEMSLPYGLDMNNQINVDKSAIRLTTTLETLSSNELISIEERAETWLVNNAPHIKSGHGTGTSIMFAHIGKRNIISMLYATTLALILISLVLIVALRSIKIGLISLIPNLAPAAMGFGLWGYMVGEIGLSLSIVSTMTLGIVVDDTVHFLSKYLRARREKNLSPEDAVRYAFATVGRALLITSIVLVAGFLVLATSSFQLNSGMGLVTALVIVLALLADFLFLPPLLIKIEEKLNAKKLLAGNTATDSATA